jgi:hypothetical protein
MNYTVAQLAQLQNGYFSIALTYQSLLLEYISFSNTHPASSEHILHGFVRRLGTLQRCIQNVYSLYHPERSDTPDRDTCVDLAINLQSFILNIFGCLDNLAWIWVTERHLTNAKGKPLAGILVGFSKDIVRNSFSTEFRDYLNTVKHWFDGLEGYRHALAHRIPLYIPPFGVTSENIARYNELETQKHEAMTHQDFQKYDLLDSDQEKLGKFNPVMMHSYKEEDVCPIYFHFQMLADWNTVVEIVDMFLKTVRNLSRSARARNTM